MHWEVLRGRNLSGFMGVGSRGNRLICEVVFGVVRVEVGQSRRACMGKCCGGGICGDSWGMWCAEIG